MNAKKKILISFVGSNDAGELLGENDGAILTALQNENFDEVILLWNEDEVKDKCKGRVRDKAVKYSDVVRHIRREIKNRKLAAKSSDEEFVFNDVTDHNEIYQKLKKFTDALDKSENISYTASISSGTPAMSVCWILLAESGDFSEKYPLRLIKVKDPRHGSGGNVEVKLNTSLPKIIRLKKEVDKLKEDLIPKCKINVTTGNVFIGEKKIDFSPIQFCYYRYFTQRAIENKGKENFSGFDAPLPFVEAVYQFYQETFPNLDVNSQFLLDIISGKNSLALTTFRSNISKLNKKLEKALENQSLFELFRISIDGKRGKRFYGINAPDNKFEIVEGQKTI